MTYTSNKPKPHSGHLDAELNQPEGLATERLVEIAHECLQRWDGFPTIPGSRRWSVNGRTALRELDRRQSILEEQFEVMRVRVQSLVDEAERGEGYIWWADLEAAISNPASEPEGVDA